MDLPTPAAITPEPVLEFTDHYELVEDKDGQQIHDFETAKLLSAGDDKRMWFIREGDDFCVCPSNCPDCSQRLTDEDETETPDQYCCPNCSKLWDYDDIRSESCDCGCNDYDVELWTGQFVNCVGFFVTTTPCKPEHTTTIFTH